jgi:serine/threonine protein kinase
MALPSAIGPYRVLGRLGAGGMAEVFLVETPGLGGTFRRHMALKRILPEHAKDDGYTQQFLDEARLLGRMHHPHIVTAADAGEHDGSYYVVMELVEGADLGRLLRSPKNEVLPRSLSDRKILPQSTAVYIASSIASALAYAHGPAFGVVHRDVSPQNILLSHHGEVLLADFGIARYAERNHRTTTTWQVKGKLEYMSPEQIHEPQTIDGRSDLFSLGIVLYQMLSGEHPFLKDLKRAEQQQVLSYMLKADTPRAIPGIEPELAQLIRKLLARDREDRPSTADQVVDVLLGLPQRASPGRLLGEEVRKVMLQPLHPQQPPEMVSVIGFPEENLSLELDLEDVPEKQPGFVIVSDSQTAAPAAPSLRAHTRPASAPPALPSTREPLLHGTASSAMEPASSSSRWRPMRVTAPLLLLVLLVSGAFVRASPDRAPASAKDVSVVPAPPAAKPPVGLLQPSANPASTPPLTPAAEAEAAPLLALPLSEPAEPTPEPQADPPVSDQLTEKAPADAQLFVAVIPWGRIWLNGKLQGEAPQKWVNLKPGRYLIEIGQDAPVEKHRVRLKPGPNRFEYSLQ